MTSASPPHLPVLLREVLEALRPNPGGIYLDATVGAGGHAESILEASAPDGLVVGLDRDPEAIRIASARLSRFADRFRPLHGDFRNLAERVREAGVFAFDGIVADLGVSSMQLDDPARGFSFRHDGPLDMRMDPSSSDPTAADLLADLDEAELKRVFREYGEERLAWPIAKAVVRRRTREPIRTTSELADLVERVAGPAARRFAIHPATRTFQALRIAVNRELEPLPDFVSSAASLLRRGGRLAVISFHSLEDRAIKRAMRALAERCVCPPGLPVCGCGRENVARIVTPKAVVPSDDEVAQNPRSRSARLRAIERL